MKAQFATWFLLIFGLGYLSEAFSNSLHSHDNDPKTVNWFNHKIRFSLTTTNISRITSLPHNFTGNTFSQISDKKFDKFQSKLSPIGDYVFGSLILVLCILALFGNGCALTIFQFRQRKLIPMEVFFISLAIADILLSVASYPMSIIASFMHMWNFGELGCTIYAFCCYFLGLSSIYTITAMAFTRYLITCKPAQGNLITCWTCCKMVAGGNLLAFLLAAMPLLGFGNYEVEPFGLGCTLDWIAKDDASRFYIILVTVFCVFFPLIILVFCYSQIIIIVKQSNALMKNNGVNKRNKKGSSGQLTLITGLISAGFVIAWFPYTIACLWTSFKGEVILPIWATPGPCIFAKSSIVYNPIIYVFLTEQYRKDFYDLVQYIRCKVVGTGKEGTHITKIVTRTNEYGSSLTYGKSSTYAGGMKEHTVEISNSYVPVLKETYV